MGRIRNFKFECPEGATPIDDISGLKIAWVKTQADLNSVEAENISTAVEKYLLKSNRSHLEWFNLTSLQNIHKDMFCDVWDWAGLFRTTQTIPGVRPFQIASSLVDLCNDVLYWINTGAEITLVEQAARIHHRLVFIHPFQNGNGRFSRLVADRYLKTWMCPFPKWPVDIHRDSKIREQYIFSLKSADLGDYGQLVDFIKSCGGKDPSLSELLGHDFYRRNIKKSCLISLIKGYLKQGYNVNNILNNDHHPLQLAIKQGMEEISKLFILAGADIHYRDKSGLTSFETAIIKKQFNIAKLLYDNGYPYTPRHPPSSRLINYYDHIYDFDNKYF